MPRIQANGVQLYYELEGSANRPVVMLSNSLGTRLEMWDAQMQALTERYRVLRYDSRGHGRSDAPDGPYTIEMLADDAIGLLDVLGIERVHFCGLSKGGMVGQVLGARHGRRLVSLALCSTACHMPQRELWDERIRLVTEGGMAAIADGVVERWFTEPFRREPTIELERTQDILSAVAERRVERGRPHVVVGFAAESRDLIENAQGKLERKRLSMIVANDISASDAGFQVDTNRVSLVLPGGVVEPLP